jgi:cholesterol oxidase
LPIQTLRARKLILSAGTLGSTYLLLKSRAAFPNLSGQLGEKFSTNGDLLAFAAHSRTGMLDPSRGPVITSTIHCAHGPNGDPHGGFFLQDAGYPEFVNWILETADAPGKVTRIFKFLWRRLLQSLTHTPVDDISGQLADILGPCTVSNGTMPLLGMGRDIPDGKMTLIRGKDGKDYLDVDWRNIRSAAYFNEVRDTCRRIAEKLGARLIQDPDTQYLNRLITVHALGGCPMGNNVTEGVVSPHGEVFNYNGLYVADGSVMPGPTGSNPSLTIAALADRFADHLLTSTGR